MKIKKRGEGVRRDAYTERHTALLVQHGPRATSELFVLRKNVSPLLKLYPVALLILFAMKRGPF